jgi:hypothetical protein
VHQADSHAIHRLIDDTHGMVDTTVTPCAVFNYL